MAKLFKHVLFVLVVLVVLSTAACGRSIDYKAILPFEDCMAGTGEVHTMLLRAEGDFVKLLSAEEGVIIVTRLADEEINGHPIPWIQVTIGDYQGSYPIVVPGAAYPVWMDDWTEADGQRYHTLGRVGWCGGSRFTYSRDPEDE